MLGICTEANEGILRKLIDEGDVTWRVWHDETGTLIDKEWKKRLAGPWRTEHWPRTYVLDHKGIIRYRALRNRELDRAVDRLLRELENDTGS
jgi:hypothetical protein